MLIDPNKTKVILIGVSEYAGGYKKIDRLSKNNINKLKKLLQDKSVLGIPENNIKCFDQEGHKDIVEGMKEFTSSRDFKTLIFYFVGHGEEHEGKFCMLTSDTDSSRIIQSSISWETDIIGNFEPKSGNGIQRRLYILDACYSGNAALKASPDKEEEKKIIKSIGKPHLKQGAAILSAATAKAYYRDDEKYTDYTKAFISIIEEGIDDESVEFLDASTIGEAIKEKLTDDKYTPDCRRRGDKIHFFKNISFDTDSTAREKVRENFMNPAKKLKAEGDFKAAKELLNIAKNKAKKLGKSGEMLVEITKLIKRCDAEELIAEEGPTKGEKPHTDESENGNGGSVKVSIMSKICIKLRQWYAFLKNNGIMRDGGAIVLIIILIMLAFGISKCYKSPPVKNNTVAYDSNRDGYQYLSFDFGQDWIIKNLNYSQTKASSFCYDNDAIHCNNFQRLYTFDAAVEACEGLDNGEWRLPREDEWLRLLEEFGGGYYDESQNNPIINNPESTYKKMMEPAIFNVKNKSGQRSANGEFFDIKNISYFWTATIGTVRQSQIIFKFSNENPYIIRDTLSIEAAISCRCVRDR